MTGLEFDSMLGTSGQASLSELASQTEEFPGIYWEERGSLMVPVEIQRAINLDIVEQLRRLAASLKTSHRPDVVFIQSLDGIAEKEVELLTSDVLLAAPSFPNGLIRIFPQHVRMVVGEKTNTSQQPSLTLIGDLGHENFHILQKEAMQKTLERDLKLASERNSFVERYAVWSVCPSEVMARDFERFWIEHWMDFSKAAK
jgi:hypothetical protein